MHPLAKIRSLSPAQKLYVQDIIPAHHRSFSEEWQHKAEAAEQQAQQTLKSFKTTTNTPILFRKFKLALTLPFTTTEQSFGIYMAL